MFLEVTLADVEAYKADNLRDRANTEGIPITYYCAVARAASRKFGKQASVGLSRIYLPREESYGFPPEFHENFIQVFDAYASAGTPDGKRCAHTQTLAKRFPEISFPVRIPLH